MQFSPGMDLSTFTHKFVRVHKASTTTDDKAGKMLIVKLNKVPDLCQNLLTARLNNPKVSVAELAEIVHKHQQLMNALERVDPQRSRKHVTALSHTEPLIGQAYTACVTSRAPASYTQNARTFNCKWHGPNYTHDTD